MEDYYLTNLAKWNELAKLHSEGTYQWLERFKNGEIILHPLEREELGDVSGKSLLHLQCHFGLDTLSIARLGAKVTGVDFSSIAIEAAKDLANLVEIEADFIESDINQLKDKYKAPASYDIVFTSHGVIGWLHDIKKWAETITFYLKPGGIFYIAELHPFAWIFEDDGDGDIMIKYDYFTRDQKPYRFEEDGSYLDPNATITNSTEYVWQHSMGDIINALIQSGLKIEFVHEFPYLTWKLFEMMENKEGDPYYHYLPSKYENRKLPLMFSLKASKL